MTILAQSLLTLVSSHLVALLLLSVWHNTKLFKYLNVKLLHLCNEALGRFESGDVVSVDNQCCVLRNVTCGFLCTVLYSERAKATQINIFLAYGHAVTNLFHKCFYCSGNILLGKAGILSDFVDDFCFCHLCIYLCV